MTVRDKKCCFPPPVILKKIVQMPKFRGKKLGKCTKTLSGEEGNNGGNKSGGNKSGRNEEADEPKAAGAYFFGVAAFEFFGSEAFALFLCGKPGGAFFGSLGGLLSRKFEALALYFETLAGNVVGGVFGGDFVRP